MTTITEKLTSLSSIKLAIKNAIERKGVILGNSTFVDYPSKIDEIATATATNEFVRPLNWLALPALNSDVDGFAGLLFFDDNSRFISLSISSTGSYTVDWGDGTVETKTGSNALSHEYNVTNPLLTDFDGNKKQAVITVTALNGATFSQVNLNSKHSYYDSAMTSFNAGWLDIAFSLSSTSTSVQLGSSSLTALTQNLYLNNLRKITFVKLQNIDISRLCYGMLSLEQIDFPANFKAKKLTNSFFNCEKLKIVNNLDLSICTDASYAFQFCKSITELLVPWVTLLACTNANYMFANMPLITQIPEGFNLPVAKFSAQMFQSDINLVRIPNSLVRVGNEANSMFSGCTALNEMPEINLTNCTNPNGMFDNCISLLDYKVTNLVYGMMLSQCYLSLESFNKLFDQFLSASTNFALGTVLAAKKNPSSNIVFTGNGGVASKTFAVSNTSLAKVGDFLLSLFYLNVSLSNSVVTYAGHGLADGTAISFSTVSLLIPLAYKKIYYVVNAAQDTFQLSDTKNGNPISFAGTKTGVMLSYDNEIVSFQPNQSITLKNPIVLSGTIGVTLTFRSLNILKYLMMGGSVTG